jgi:GNAT superfamily N-acetyltransferase
MNIEILQSKYLDIESMRELYRHEARCQIVHYSALSRGIADPYVIRLNGRIAGYAGVWNKYYPDRVMEFYTLKHMRRYALPMFGELLKVNRATHIEAQTNIPLMLIMLHDYGKNIVEEKILFEEGFTTKLDCPAGVLRQHKPGDHRGAGEWVVDVDGTIVATGGVLYHYNPPYGDIYVEVSETERRKGYGSYLVQKLKRICYEAGKIPAARCDPSNVSSRLTLEKAGFLQCGYLLAGEVRNPETA